MKFFSVIILICSGAAFAADPPCNDFFEEVVAEEKANDPVSDLIAYLNRLLEENKIGEKELKRLAQGEAPITEEESRTRMDLKVFREDIEGLRSKHNTDLQKVAIWSRRALEYRQQDLENRDVVTKTTTVPFHPMRFHTVPGDEYDMEVMETLVTQKHWFDIMGANPNSLSSMESKSSKSEGSAYMFNAEGVKVFLKPDQPAVRISWWSILEFANRMSIRDGLDPVYDLDTLEFSGSAEEGDLQPSSQGGITYNQLVRHRNGYRLPTVKEWDYFATRNHELMTIGDYLSEKLIDIKLFEDALLGANELNDVAKTPPIIINGNTFYDFIGLASEWTDHPYEKYRAYYPEKSNILKMKSRITKGHYQPVLLSPNRLVTKGIISSISTRQRIGFRLVRTLE